MLIFITKSLSVRQSGDVTLPGSIQIKFFIVSTATHLAGWAIWFMGLSYFKSYASNIVFVFLCMRTSGDLGCCCYGGLWKKIQLKWPSLFCVDKTFYISGRGPETSPICLTCEAMSIHKWHLARRTEYKPNKRLPIYTHKIMNKRMNDLNPGKSKPCSANSESIHQSMKSL